MMTNRPRRSGHLAFGKMEGSGPETLRSFTIEHPEVLIGLIITLTICAIALLGREVPQALSLSLTTVVGYYFGSMKAEKKDAARAQNADALTPQP